MEIKEILNKLNEDLNEDIARKNLEANDYDIENIEKRELRTMYDTYTYYGDVSCGVIKAEDFEEQAINIKRLYYKYKARVCSIDANGLGIGLIDFMTKTQIDP